MAASIARLATASGVAALDGLLNETLRLAAEARGYVVTGGPSMHRPEAVPLAQLVEACELLDGLPAPRLDIADDPGAVPDNLRDMLDRSLALYRRVARLNRRLDA